MSWGEELELDLQGKAECGGSQGQGWSLITPLQRRLLQLLVTSIEIPNPAPPPRAHSISDDALRWVHYSSTSHEKPCSFY